jgi:hypothetical protein
MSRMLRLWVVSVALLLAACVWSAAAGAVTIGQTGTDAACVGFGYGVQTGVSAGTSYAVPAGSWTLSQWSTQASAAGGSMAVLVFRPIGAGSYLVVGASPVIALTPNALNASSASIAVSGGDLLGLWASNGTGCFSHTGNGADTLDASASNTPLPAVGSTVALGNNAGFRLNISASLDPPSGAQFQPPGSPPVCSGTFQSRPYLDVLITRLDVFDAQGGFLGDNVSPTAVPLADLPAELTGDRYFQTYAGTPGSPQYLLLCNAASVLARYGLRLTLTSTFVDTTGAPVPATPPWVVNGTPRPTVLQVGRATR